MRQGCKWLWFKMPRHDAGSRWVHQCLLARTTVCLELISRLQRYFAVANSASNIHDNTYDRFSGRPELS
jgi:hypothetical protein